MTYRRNNQRKFNHTNTLCTTTSLVSYAAAIPHFHKRAVTFLALSQFQNTPKYTFYDHDCFANNRRVLFLNIKITASMFCVYRNDEIQPKGTVAFASSVDCVLRFTYTVTRHSLSNICVYLFSFTICLCHRQPKG